MLYLRYFSSMNGNDASVPNYRTFILNPLLFTALSAAIVVRSVIEHPVQGLGIVVFYICTYVGYRLFTDAAAAASVA
jgi:hypothetical protein